MLRGTFWSYAINYGGRFISLVSTVVLARLLTQDDFGVAGYALLFTSFIDVLSGFGIVQALIYHKDEPGIKDTAFWGGVFTSLVLFAVTWFCAPFAGLYFQDARAIPVIQVLGLTYPIAALSNVHFALLQKNLSFGKQFIPEFAFALLKAVIAISLAVMGYGPWSLIIGQVGSKLVSVFVYWLVLPWRPSFIFVKEQFRRLMSYGMSSALINIVSAFQMNLDYLLISRFLGASALGVYTLAFRIPEIAILQLCSAISDVIFPVFTMLREEAAALQKGFLQATQYTLIIVVPLGAGLALVSQPLVLLLFSDKWIQAIPVMQAISIFCLARALPYFAGVVYKAKAQQALLIKIIIIENIILLPALYWVITTFHSIAAVGWAQALFALIFGLVRSAIALRMLDTSFQSFIKAILPSLTSGILMTIAVITAQWLSASSNLWFVLIISIFTGCLTYIAALYTLDRDALLKAVQILSSARNRGS
jgi:PST family polysaccharide transporter